MADRRRSLSTVPAPAAPTPRRLPPTHQVVLAAGVIVAILAALVVVAIASLLSLREDQVQLQDRNVPYAVAIATAALNAKGMANDERGYLISGNREFLVEFDQRLNNARTAFAEAVIAADGDKQHRAVSVAREGFEDWVLAVREEFKVFQRGERRRATRTALGPVRSLRKEYEAELADAQAVATTAIELRRNSFASAGWLLILIEGLIAVVVLGFVVSIWLMRSLNAAASSSPPAEAQPPQTKSPQDVGHRHG
jgi:methyl-accepting chemotaxis protein